MEDIKLDPTNKKILDILQDNNTITYVELSKKIGLSPASTFERIKKLERNGIIEKNVALVDGKKIGKGTTAFVIITMSKHSDKAIKELKYHMQQIPEVLECYGISGEKDYIIKIVAEDIRSCETIIVNKLCKIPGIARFDTHFVLINIKRETKLTIPD